MKRKKTNRNLSYFSFILVLIFTSIISCTGQKNNTEVINAYQLRINGYADSAKVLLSSITDKNPDNTLAWFELSRTIEHIGMSNPREMQKAIDESFACINKAIELDNRNAKYLSYKGRIQTLQMYSAMKIGGNEGGVLLKIEETYAQVEQIDDSYYENKLALVEFFGGLPTEYGGDSAKAEIYTQELEKVSLIFGAKAREILMSEDADYEAFWKDIIEKEPQNADAVQALGRVYLFIGDVDKAIIQYQKAIDIDNSKKELYLDLGRYYMMMGMQGQMPIDSIAPMIEEYFYKYLDFEPAPNKPMKAWVYGTLSMINSRTGNKEKAEAYQKDAEKSDPFYSRAFGKPFPGLYDLPEEVGHYHTYYLSPF